jgi:hypothetical protein
MNTHDFEQFAASANLPMSQAKLPPPAGSFMGDAQPPPPVPQMPVAYVPSAFTTITQSSAELMKVIAPTKTLFLRGTDLVTIEKDSDGRHSLHTMLPQEFRSFAEGHVAFYCKHWDAKKEAFVAKPCILSNDAAGAVMACRSARQQLPTVSCIVNCPRLRKDGSVTSSGYDSAAEIFVAGELTITEPNSVEEAAASLLNLFRDYSFAQESDRSRAIAALLSLMLRLGPWHGEKIAFPIILVEADQSQTGKGFYAKIIAAVYGEMPSLVAVSRGGVGSFDEALSKTLLRGRPFVQLDNLRGRIDSQALEAFSTSAGPIHVRALRRDGEVDSRHFVIFATSNGMESTDDLANRLLVVRLKKQPSGYQWHQWPDGSILKHIEAHRGFYLGCVCKIFRAWMAAGSPQTCCRHDMREFAGTMDWIVQNLFKLPSLAQDHADIQIRVAKPGLGFLREVALSLDTPECRMTVADMVDLAVEEDFAIPGIEEHPTDDEARGKAMLHLGKLIGACFREGSSIVVDGVTIERQMHSEKRQDGNGSFTRKIYIFRNPSRRGLQGDSARWAVENLQSSTTVPSRPQSTQPTTNYGATYSHVTDLETTTTGQSIRTNNNSSTVMNVHGCCTTVTSSGGQSLQTENYEKQNKKPR